MRIIRSLQVATWAAAGVLLLASCSPAVSQNSDAGTEGIASKVTEAAYQQIYSDAVMSFGAPLPDGVSFPEQADPRENLLDVDAKGDAFFFWQCAWVDVYLTEYGSGSPALQSAVTMLTTTWKSLDFAQHHIDNTGDVWENEVYGPADLGDTGPMRDFYSAVCGWYQETVHGG